MRESISKHISYDHLTGNFSWLISGPGRKEKPGSINKLGYVCISINGKTWYGHRLAWLLHYGYLPQHIDHKNGIRNDNRISNLRKASKTENNMNSVMRKDNTSGVKGVCWKNREQRWHAQISINGKNKSLGYFVSKDDAAKAYDEFSKIHHSEFHICNRNIT